MKIYLAGKISKNGWRNAIVDPGMGPEEMSEDLCRYPVDATWKAAERAIFGEHDYTGPFFVACDHGCSHGASEHGVTASMMDANPGGWTCAEAVLGDRERWSRRRVFAACRAAIADSDLVFCWIDDATAYGTLAEVGMANGLGVPSVVAYPPGFNDSDLWFVNLCATHHRATDPIRADDAAQALRLALADERIVRVVNRKRGFRRRKKASELLALCAENSLAVATSDERVDVVRFRTENYPGEFEAWQKSVTDLHHEINKVARAFHPPPNDVPGLEEDDGWRFKDPEDL